MKLYYSPTSPYARKVRISAQVLGLEAEIELIQTDVYSPEKDYVNRVNPLNKVPALETREGQILINSPFICDYLCSLNPSNGLLPAFGPDRWMILNNQAVADGILDAAILRRYESQRSPEKQDAKFDLRQRDKIHEGFQFLEKNVFNFHSDLRLDGIAVMCALGYMEFRFAREKWLEKFPRLQAWYWSRADWKPFSSTAPA